MSIFDLRLPAGGGNLVNFLFLDRLVHAINNARFLDMNNLLVTTKPVTI